MKINIAEILLAHFVKITRYLIMAKMLAGLSYICNLDSSTYLGTIIAGS